MADINNIRTLEDLTNVVSQLYFNLNNIERLYYTIFIDPVPKDNIELERYDENGQLGVITLKNRAADMRLTIVGAGEPNGIVSAALGTFYLDVDTGFIWYKATGTTDVDNQGWAAIQKQGDLSSIYLKKDGDGSQLKNITASIGVLGVDHGGTGTTNIAGMVKANGLDLPYSAAVEGEDYVGPGSLVGNIMYYAGNPLVIEGSSNIVPRGWLVCNGAGYRSTDYPRLYERIGTLYGSGNGDDDTDFNVPNLIGRFIKGSENNNGTTEAAGVGNHVHSVDITSHKHGRGDLNVKITGKFSGVGFSGNEPTFEGAFYRANRGGTGGVKVSHKWVNGGICGPDYNNVWHLVSPTYADANVNDYFGFDSSLNSSTTWSGSTGTAVHSTAGSAVFTTTNNTQGVTKNTVDNLALIPIIKY